jgi:hypothetical protein
MAITDCRMVLGFFCIFQRPSMGRMVAKYLLWLSAAVDGSSVGQHQFTQNAAR